MAVANYTDSNGHYPPAYQLGPDGRPWHSWRVLVLPYIEGDAIFKRYRFDEPWDGPNNRTLADLRPRTFGFPVDRDRVSHVANYLAVVGPETLWAGEKPLRGLPPDGASDTILFVENSGLDVHWMEPRDLTFADMSFELQRPDGVSSVYSTPGVAMADGSVRSLGPKLTPEALRALLTADGGEKLDGDWQVIDDGRNRPLRN